MVVAQIKRITINQQLSSKQAAMDFAFVIQYFLPEGFVVRC
jgi:hypothetical protein